MTDTHKTPDCDMHEALVSYLYGEATTQESRLVETHLAECSACKQELAGFERVRGMLQQWQLDDLPIVRFEVTPKRSALAVLRELFTIAPLWAKALGAVATVMLVLAILGTEVSIDKNGFSMRADLLGDPRIDKVSEPIQNGPSLEQIQADVRTMLVESERQQKEELQMQLVSLKSQLQNMQSADLAKLAARIQEHRAKIRTLERDIDRREGLDLTDILFSEMTSSSGERASNRSGSGGD